MLATCHRVLASSIEMIFSMKALGEKAGKSFEASTFTPLVYPRVRRGYYLRLVSVPSDCAEGLAL